MRHSLNDSPERPDDFNGQEGITLHRRRRIGVLGWCTISLAAILVIVVAAAGLFVWNIQRERNSAFLRQHFMDLLKTGLGPDNQLMLDEAGIRLAGVNPTFSVSGLAVKNPQTGAYAQLDRADFGLSKLSLWRLSPEAKTIRFEGFRLVVPAARDQEAPLAANEALTLLRAVLGAVHFAVSGQDASFNALGAIEGKDISLLRREVDGKTTLLHTGLQVSVVRQDETSIIARVRKTGIPGAIELRAKSVTAADGSRSITVESEDLTAANLFALLGTKVEGIGPEVRFQLKLHSRMGTDNLLQETGVSLVARGGHITPPDTDMIPFDLDEAAVDLRVRTGSTDVLIDRLQVRFNETNILARGVLTHAAEGGGIEVRLKAERAELDRLSASEPLLVLDQATLDGKISADLRSFSLTRLAIQKDDGSATMAGRFSLDDGGSIETQVDVNNFDLRNAMRAWPIWIAPNVRRWLVAHAESGTLAALSMRSALAGEALHDAFNRRPIPDAGLGLTYRLENLQLRPVPDAAAINGLVVAGVSSGRRARIDVKSGWIEPIPKERFEIKGAELVVGDTSKRPALLEMSIPASGRLPGLLAFLSAPSLKSLVGLPPDASASDGTFEAKAVIAMPITRNPSPKDTRVEIRADTRNVVIDNIVKGEKLEDGTISFVSKSGQVSGKGEGRILGVPSQIEFRVDPGKAAVAIVKTVLDEATLARKGIQVRSMMIGSIGATFTIPLGLPGATPIDVDLDLARAKLETGVPGISKRSGQSGRAKFSLLARPEGTTLSNFEFDSGTNAFRGKIDLARDGQLAKVEFSSFKVSSGDNARLNIERVRGVTKLSLRANSFDIRPFLRGFQSGKTNPDKAAESKAGDLDLDLQSTVLVGFNGELMSAVEASIVQRGGRLTQLALKGQFAGSPVSARTSASDADSIFVQASTSDGGSLVRFLDLYPRAFGGKLTAEISLGAQSQQGVVQMRDFVIRGEPSLRQVGSTARSPGQVLQADSDDVSFTKFRAEFTRRTGRLDVKEAVMWGAQVGGSIDGMIDYANDQVSLKGAFVPAYALNNLFAQVPIFGRLLGGSQYEGLFAVPFVITGKASAPVLRTNPVSAIAPGFLRKIFEIRNDSR